MTKKINDTVETLFRGQLQAPVVQTTDSAIHRINHYPADRVMDFRNTYPLIVIYPVDSAIQRLNNRGQDWGKSPLNTGWAEKAANGFFYSAMESAAVIISSSCIMYRKIMIITAILCV